MEQAVILVGGRGTRLKPAVSGIPKPMAPVDHKPFLEYQLRELAEQGISEFVFCTGYRGDVIQSYFGDGAAWGVHITYSTEDPPRDTGGALKLAAPLLSDEFFVLNGDTFTTLDAHALADFHAAHHALATLALTRQTDPRAYGEVELDPGGRITAFYEKVAVAIEVGTPFLVNAGMYRMKRRLLDALPADRTISLEREVFPQLAAAGAALYGIALPGYFIDIGTPPTYRQFVHDIETGIVHAHSQ